MEVNDWTPTGKESFTTPGGPFRYPAGESGRTYAYGRAEAPRPAPGQEAAPVRPAPRQEAAASPFAPRTEPRPWYAGVQAETEETPVVVSADGQAPQTVVTGTGPYGEQTITIQLPPVPRAPAPRQKLWWVPLVLILALGIGLGLGLLLYPLLGFGGTAQPVTPAAPAGEDRAGARIYEENLASVVSVRAEYDDSFLDIYTPPSVGTGFLITADGYLLTCAHVVNDAPRITVTLSGGETYAARLVRRETQTSDLALLKIEAQGLTPVTLGDASTARVGDEVFTIGNPLGELAFSLTAGHLSAGPRTITTGSLTYTMLQTDAAINKGNSGGPLFDREGKVLAVVTAKYTGGEADTSVEGLGFALPINDVMALAEAWMAEDKAAP